MARSGPVRVAVLDDQAASRTGVEAIVDAEPDMLSVGSASDEAELHWLLRRTAPDVVVLDFRHRGRSGLAVTMSLKRAVRSPRVVLHTGHAGPLLTVAAALAGVDAVADKTAPHRELLAAIRDAAGGRPSPAVSLLARVRAAERVDPADHAILAMRLERTPWPEIAHTLGEPVTAILARANAMIGRLAAPAARADPLATAGGAASIATAFALDG